MDHTLYTRWVEVKLADGMTIKGEKRPTAIPAGQPKPALHPDIAADWIRNCEARGQTVVKIGFKYRKR